MIFVFYLGGVNELRKEVTSIPQTKSVSSSAQYWNHSWQASPKCFPYTVATKILPHPWAVGIWFAYIGQFFWGYTTPGSKPASKALPYQTPR